MRSKAHILLLASILVTTAMISDASARVDLIVYQDGPSNVVFRIKNNTTNSIRLPSAGYVLLDRVYSASTNLSYGLAGRPVVEAGLRLATDWRQVGTNWMFASNQAWRKRLKVRTLEPGGTLGIARSFGPWRDLILTNTNAVACFEFSIPQKFAKEFDLWHGSLCVTGLTEVISPGLGPEWADIQQMLDVYAKLTGAKLDVQDDVRKIHTQIRIEYDQVMTRPEAITFLEKALHDQAGIVVKHLDAKHIRITLQR